MSTKESFLIEHLDCLAIKTLFEKVKSAELAVKTHTDLLDEARAVYVHSFMKLAVGAGKKDLSDLDQYMVNFATSQLEPIPPPPAIVPQVPVRAPDADEPPAPFREQETKAEVVQ